MQETIINATVAPETNTTTTEPEKKIRVIRRLRKTSESWLGSIGDIADLISINTKAKISSSKRELAINDLNERIEFQKNIKSLNEKITKLNDPKITDITSLIKSTDKDVDAVLKSIF